MNWKESTSIIRAGARHRKQTIWFTRPFRKRQARELSYSCWRNTNAAWKMISPSAFSRNYCGDSVIEFVNLNFSHGIRTLFANLLKISITENALLKYKARLTVWTKSLPCITLTRRWSSIRKIPFAFLRQALQKNIIKQSMRAYTQQAT